MACLGKFPCENGCGSPYDDLGYYEHEECYNCPLFGCALDSCKDCTNDCIYNEFNEKKEWKVAKIWNDSRIGTPRN